MAATDTKSVVVKANIGEIVKVVVDTNSITFPNSDPDETKRVPALENNVKVTVKARTGGLSTVTLKIIADGDLVSGADTIPIENVIWQASGEGFRSGTLSKSNLQTAGAWKGSGIHEGVFGYYLLNSWNFLKGNYQATITYTLTSP